VKLKLLIPIFVLLLVAGGGAAWYLKLLPFGPTSAPAAPPEPGSLEFVLPEHIVNLSDKAGYRYLKIRVALEFSDPAHRPGELSGDALTAQQGQLSSDLGRFSSAMDDFMITTLTSKTAAELLTTDGKEQLRDQLLNGFKTRIPSPALRAVYFTEFVIQ
jgi:flagellar basal body-associated protein FliL